MTKNNPFPVRLGLLFSTKNDREYFHATAYPVTIGATAWEQRWRADHPDEDRPSYADIMPDTIRNANDDRINGLTLGSLQVNSQGNNDDAERHLYGFDIRYRDLHAVDLRAATAMQKTLATIDRRMARLDAKYGRPQTFGAYVARVADAIGADAIVTVEGPTTGWHHTERHRFNDIKNGVFLIDHEIRKWANARTAQETATA